MKAVTVNGHGRGRVLPISSFHEQQGASMTAEASALMDSNEIAELLVRVDERTKTAVETFKELNTKIDKHDTRLASVESKVDALAPVKKIVYSGIAIILTAILMAVMALVVSRPTIKEAMQPTQKVDGTH